MKPLFVEFRASEEIHEISTYYEEQREGLGIEFQIALKSAFLRICRSPDAFRFNDITKTRMYQLKRFPHIVHYQQLEASIAVVAVAHPKRCPGYWMK